VADYYDIAIIGSGNLAWHLAPELENAGHRIVDIFSPNVRNAKALQRRLYNAEINRSLDFSNSKANIYIICVSDRAIEKVAQEIALPENAIIIHTSGSQSISQLGYTASQHLGVFYPLQTFTKNKRITFEDIPILIETENQFTSKILNRLAKSLSKKVVAVSSKDRMAIHVAAVFACNFTNHLFEISDQILRQHGFNFQMLQPLIAETVNKSLELGPAQAQTGPATREDMETLDNHMDFLQGSEYQAVYKLITDLIIKR
jgi:predicted short-subunit dehydrogenase-like oxidoreductase (DUF2520 family)